MTKKNKNASAIYTYHEKQLDTRNSGYGTQRARLNKDSIKDFDACSLSLQYCNNPVITASGVLFDKEAILQYIVQKKVDIMRKVKEYDKQLKSEQKEFDELASAQQKDKIDKFLKNEKSIVIHKKEGEAKKSVDVTSKKNSSKEINNFWIPSRTPAASASKLKKPDTNIYCPITGEIIKAKDLIPIKFTLIDPNDKDKKLHSKEERYKCLVSGDSLSNSIPCAVLKTSGNVVCMECVNKFIRKDMLDPINGAKMKESDIIQLIRGGTGFSGSNDLIAKIKTPVMQA